jgi:hypothetical protein
MEDDMRVFAFATMATLIGILSAGQASAEIISTFTGSWQLQSDTIPFKERQSILQMEGPISATLTGRLGFHGLVSNYVDQGSDCSIESFPCTETWSGDLNGTMYFVAYSGSQGGQYSFAGTITSGSFEGLRSCDFDECLGENHILFHFASTGQGAPGYGDAPTHGWSSEGTLDVRSGDLSIGTLTMTTTVPEPGMTALLGAGMTVLAVRKRRRPLK